MDRSTIAPSARCRTRHAPTRPAPPRRGWNDAAVAGAIWCFLSALSYSATNACMRRVDALGVDPIWAVVNKEAVTVVVVGPWILLRAARGRIRWPSRGALALLAGVSLVSQTVANTSLQWSYGVVGLAVATPVVFALMITSSGILGWTLLGERISARAGGGIALLLGALAALGVATYAAQGPGELARGRGPAWLLLGIAAPGLAGVIYALLTTTIRHARREQASVAVIVFVTTGMALVTLGPASVARLGLATLLETPREHLFWIYLAGFFNLLGFLAVTQALERTAVVHANVINSTQVVLAALAGVAWFGEAMTTWLGLGVALTLAGIVLVEPPMQPPNRQPDPSPPTDRPAEP